MRFHGCRIEFPRHTPREKSYLWRTLSRFHDKVVNDWGMDPETTRFVVESAIRYGRERNILKSRGAGIINTKGALEVAKQYAEEEAQRSSGVIDRLRRCKSHLAGVDLVRSRRLGGQSNLLSLFESGLIPAAYLALSRSAHRALQAISEWERERLPSDKDLFAIRFKTLRDPLMGDEVREVFGKDLLEG